MSERGTRMNVTIDTLAQEIRRVDGNHNLGAAALAEALMPFIEAALSHAPSDEPFGWWVENSDPLAMGQSHFTREEPEPRDPNEWGGWGRVVPLYERPHAPSGAGEAVEKHLPLRRVDTDDFAEIFDRHGEKVALTVRPDLIMALNSLALPATEEKAADVKPEAAGSWSIASAGPWHVENWNASAYTSVGIAKDGEVKAIAVSVGDADEGDYIVAALNAYASPIPAPPSELEAREAADGWNSIATCPIRDPVDLWCVYGGEEFAQYEGGASIGKLVPNRIKTKEYGFFGNQSDNGVPQRDAPDLVPVAWRKAVPDCPATIIAEALHIPVTLEAARAALANGGR